jgi:hypothetical protein
VKSWRIWLLLLLAVLLPVRGAVAAAMMCPVAGFGVQVELAMGGHSAGHEAMDRAMSHNHSGGHDHASSHGHPNVASDDGHPGHDHAVSEGCNACSAYCSVTPLVSAIPTLAEPLGRTTVKFSDFSAPPPSFVSGGQERPPRTI